MFLNFYRKKGAFGLDLSDYSLKLLELEGEKGEYRARTVGSAHLEKGIVVDGKIINRSALIAKLHEAIDHSLPLRPRTRRIIISLPESKTFIHVFSIPKDLTQKEKEGLILERAKSLIPVDAADLAWAVQDLGAKDHKEREVLFAAATREMVHSYEELFHIAEMELVAIDLESASIARVVSRLFHEQGPALIIDIGVRTTNMTIVEGPRVVFSATIPVAGYHLTEALTRGLRVSFERGEVLKREVGLSPAKQGGRVMMILQSVLQQVIREAQKATHFYEEKTGERITSIFLTGGSALLPELDTYFQLNVGRPARILDPWQGIAVDSHVIPPETHPVFFANVIGLALRGLEADPAQSGINLLSQKARS